MSNRHSVARNELELMKGVWEWWFEVEATTELLVDVSMQRTERRGIFRLSVVVFMPSDVNKVLPVARYQAEWPNARQQTFAGFMMYLMTQVERLASDAYDDAHKKHIPAFRSRRGPPWGWS